MFLVSVALLFLQSYGSKILLFCIVSCSSHVLVGWGWEEPTFVVLDKNLFGAVSDGKYGWIGICLPLCFYPLMFLTLFFSFIFYSFLFIFYFSIFMLFVFLNFFVFLGYNFSKFATTCVFSVLSFLCFFF